METIIDKRESTFRLKANALLGLQFLSDFGDQITTALLALCMLDITKSAGKVGLVYFITTAGFVVFTLIGGYLGDKLCKRNVLFYADISRGIIVLLMILALTQKSIFLIYFTSFFLSILGSLHRPAKLSIWAQTIPTNSLLGYNSFSEFSTQASTIIGPAIASFFIAHGITNLGFAVDAATFFLCAFGFSIIISDKSPSAPECIRKKRDLFGAFKIITGDHEISKYIYYDAIQMVGFGAFNATFLVLAQRDFGWTKAEYSYHLSIIAAFALMGAFLGGREFVAKISVNTKLVMCALLSAIALSLVLYFRSFPLSSLLFGICDGLAVITMVITRTKVQLLALNEHSDLLASILASRSIIIKTATLLGTCSCLVIGDYLSLETTLALYIIPIALSFLPFIRHREPLLESKNAS